MLDGLTLLNRGKVRDIYDVDDYVLIVTSDRISIYDVILPDPIPDKGKVLTRISRFWFDRFGNDIPHHFITTDINDMPASVRAHADVLDGRAMLVKKATPLPVECIVRGYLSGSGYRDYQRSGTICGIDLPTGLRESEQLPEILFTPSTKAEQGDHDENISFGKMCSILGSELAETLRKRSIDIYKRGAAYARERGIIIADTKFEFGRIGDDIVLIDEVLTPDSSRFWPADLYEPGRAQDSFDKQFVRDYYTHSGWDKVSNPAPMPAEIIRQTREKYLTLEQLLTT